MNACITLMMGLAAVGYQAPSTDPFPLPAPAAEEVTPAPLPVETPATDAFAPEQYVPAPAPQSFAPPPHEFTFEGDPGFLHGSPAFPAATSFHAGPALEPIPMGHACGAAASCACGCQSGCRQRKESGRHGCCLSRCCENSTCDMPPHFPYAPADHGYYYFRPYNYTHVFEHQALISSLGGDPRAPYSTADFARYYEFGPLGPGPGGAFEESLRPLPHLARPLPNLESLLHAD